jgi:hypothetical protein
MAPDDTKVGAKRVDTPKRVGLLDEYLSEAQLAAELGKDIRTIQRWRKLRIGPPVTMKGITPIYNIATTRAWLSAGGTASAKPQSVKRGR